MRRARSGFDPAAAPFRSPILLTVPARCHDRSRSPALEQSARALSAARTWTTGARRFWAQGLENAYFPAFTVEFRAARGLSPPLHRDHRRAVVPRPAQSSLHDERPFDRDHGSGIEPDAHGRADRRPPAARRPRLCAGPYARLKEEKCWPLTTLMQPAGHPGVACASTPPAGHQHDLLADMRARIEELEEASAPCHEELDRELAQLRHDLAMLMWERGPIGRRYDLWRFRPLDSWGCRRSLWVP